MEFDPTAFESFELLSEGEEDEGGTFKSPPVDTQLDARDDDSAGGAVRKFTINKTACLLVVHVTHALFQEAPTGAESPRPALRTRGERANTKWREVMQGMTGFLRSRIITAPMDKVGVVLFGIANSKNDLKLPGIYTLFELGFPNATLIVELERYASMTVQDFCKTFGRILDSNDTGDAYDDDTGDNTDTTPKIADLFWCCAQTFSSKSSAKTFKNRILLFTCDDNPCRDDSSLKRSAVQRARDLYEGGATIDLVPLKSDGVAFDTDLFYKDALFIDEADADVTNSQHSLHDLHSDLWAKESQIRVMSRVPLKFGPDDDGDNFTITLGIFLAVRRVTVPTGVYLRADDNTLLKAETKYLCEETGVLLSPDQIGKYLLYGAEKVFLEPEERSAVVSFPGLDLMGMSLMGFKPVSRIKPRYSIKHTYFAHPLESPPYGVAGSGLVAQALLLKMAQRQMAAIVRWQSRQNTAMRFAALLPQMEEVDSSGTQLRAPGFHVIPLPFSEDIRKVNLDESLPPGVEEMNSDSEAEADEAPQWSAAKAKAVQDCTNVLQALALQSCSVCRDVSNPVLQQHCLGVEALALGSTEVAQGEDGLQPDVEAMAALLGDDIAQLKDSIFGGYGSKVGTGRGGARSPAAKKRTRDSPAPAPVDDQHVLSLYGSGDLSKLKVVELKGYLAGWGLPVSGRKDDLMSRVEDYIAASQAVASKRHKAANQDSDDENTFK